jgi:hypothetical protein
MKPATRSRFVLAAVAAVLIALPYASQLWVLRARVFVVDEFEHLHAAWCISQGLVPYRDFFEHHTPWYHAALSWAMRIYRPEASPDRAVDFLFLARESSWALTGTILACTFLVAKRVRDDATAWAATAMLANTPMFLDKSLEVRPDLLAVVFLLLANLPLRGGLRNRRGLFASGALLAGSVLSSQKALFVLPGFLAMFLRPLAVRSTRKDALSEVAAFALGFAAPIALTLTWFATKGAAGIFVTRNFVENAQWRAHFGPAIFFKQLVRESPALVGLAFAGWLGAAWRIGRNQIRSAAESTPAFEAVSLVAGLFVIPVPYPQYFFLFLPLAAIYAGAALTEICDWAVEDPTLRQGAAAAVLLSVAIPVLRGRPAAVDEKNGAQVELIRYVQENTAPSDTVMDGWTGLGVFRPHAYYYSFLHKEVRAMLTDEDRRDLLTGLESGRIRPELVFLDRDLKAVSPPVTSFLEDHYAPVVGNIIWKRKA